MIRTITVYTGEGDYAKFAQEHAIQMAEQLDARLRVIGIWKGDENLKTDVHGVSIEPFIERNQQEIVEAAERVGIRVDGELRGDGLTRGLLEEARATDLLVLGLPTERQKDRDDATSSLIRQELPILRKAECAMLLVSQAPATINRILLRHDTGFASKAALRMAGAIAERYHARLSVLTVDNDLADAVGLASAAEEYLKAYDVPTVETLPKAGPMKSKLDILAAAESSGADLIVMGDEEHTWLERAFGANVAERAALSTAIPLLIAR